MNRVYTVAEISHILRISTKTTYQLVREGDLPAIRVRGQIRITSEALAEYMKGGKNEEA